MYHDPNQRPPCGGWNDATYFGGCNQQYVAASASAVVLANNTKVPDYYAGTGVADPFAMPNFAIYFPACATYTPACDGVLEPPCGLLDPAEVVIRGPVIVDAGYFQNSYLDSGTTQSITACGHDGFKSLQAVKIWQGKLPFKDRSYGVLDSMDYNCQCGYHAEDTAPTQVKYLTQTGASSYKMWVVNDYLGNPYDAYVEATATISNAVDRYSGVSINTCASSSNAGAVLGDPLYDQDLTDQCKGLFAYLDKNISEVAAEVCGRINGMRSSSPPTLDPPDVIVQNSANGYTLTWQTIYKGVTVDWTRITVDADFSFVVDWYGVWTVSGDWGHRGTETLEFTDTTVHYNDTHGSGVITGHEDNNIIIDFVGTLSNPYTAAELKADILHLLAQWDLGDDKLYPWRADANIGFAPLVQYDEVGGTFGSCTEDLNGLIYSGEIIGKPIDIPGYVVDRFFDFKHENWAECTDMFGVYRWIESYGAWNTSTGGIPASAPNWTNKYYGEFAQLPLGAYLMYDAGGSTMYAQIWVEAKQPAIQSFDFARPCGPGDRWQLTSSAACIVDEIGTTLTTQTVHGLTTGDKCYVCGTTQDGAWTITVTGTASLNLTTQLASASQMPTIMNPTCEIGRAHV